MIQTGGVQAGLVTFSNNAVTYTLSNVGGDTSSTSGIGGTAIVLVSGSGTVNFNGQNTYSGGTTISSGTLAAGAAGALGSGNVAVAGGTLTESVANALNGGATQSLTVSSGTATPAPSPITSAVEHPGLRRHAKCREHCRHGV